MYGVWIIPLKMAFLVSWKSSWDPESSDVVTAVIISKNNLYEYLNLSCMYIPELILSLLSFCW